MRNYLILNGNNSINIKGLLIQSLPPISKPKIRTQIEEIDGRDGDIITPLGYSAYTKEFNIGLYDDFDIDEIIAYFNTSGIAVFSNEPDKFYKYEILEQIDFKRLIRFKTATVKMHVQPFKYSLTDNEKSFNISNNLINFNKYTVNSNGLKVVCDDNKITVTGTATQNVEILIPVTAPITKEGDYQLKATVTGTGSASTQLRLIKDSISNSFGNAALSLADDTTVSLDDSISESITYNYIYLKIGTTLTNYSIDVELVNEVPENSIQIRNSGNIYSKPKMIIKGSGDIGISLNGVQLFQIALGNLESITIDTAQMEAYNGSSLLNRLVTGNYDNFKLNIGLNTISWTGNITQIDISNYSRWI